MNIGILVIVDPTENPPEEIARQVIAAPAAGRMFTALVIAGIANFLADILQALGRFGKALGAWLTENQDLLSPKGGV